MKDSNDTKPNKHPGGRPRKGSLQYKGSTWYAVLTVTIDGESMRKWVRLDTDNKAIARRKLAKLLKETPGSLVDLDESAQAPETYGELAERVRKSRRQVGIRDVKTEESNESLWILPEIGHLSIQKIRPFHISGLYENAAGKGKSLSHLRHLRMILKSRFAVVVEEETIEVSPTDKAKMPKVDVDTRERATLTDSELAIYLAWQHPIERFRIGALERQTMSCIARMFGGVRTGDLHAMKWDHFDTSSTPDVSGAFTWGMALRRKTRRPQRIVVPESLRSILRDWWMRSGKPTEGVMFPAMRGERAKVSETGVQKQGVSHAAAMRRDLQAAFEDYRAANQRLPKEALDACAPAKDSARWLELFTETEFTRPVDFHSWRRKFVQVLADIGLNAQQAQKLAGHADLAAHERYLQTTAKTLTIPAGALPDFRIVEARNETSGISQLIKQNTSQALVAQRTEQRFPKPKVTGSTPVGGAERFEAKTHIIGRIRRVPGETREHPTATRDDGIGRVGTRAWAMVGQR